MKKLIIILLLIPVLANAQIKQDAIDHATIGFIIAGIVNIETYEIIKDTGLNPKLSKAIALFAGVGAGILVGHAKEIYDSKHGGYYSKKDFKATSYGTLAGSFTIRLILWNSIPESHVPIEDLWQFDNLYE